MREKPEFSTHDIQGFFLKNNIKKRLLKGKKSRTAQIKKSLLERIVLF